MKRVAIVEVWDGKRIAVHLSGSFGSSVLCHRRERQRTYSVNQPGRQRSPCLEAFFLRRVRGAWSRGLLLRARLYLYPHRLGSQLFSRSPATSHIFACQKERERERDRERERETEREREAPEWERLRTKPGCLEVLLLVRHVYHGPLHLGVSRRSQRGKAWNSGCAGPR